MINESNNKWEQVDLTKNGDEQYAQMTMTEEKTKQVLAGYTYEFKTNRKVKSCFIDGVECFVVQDIYDFMCTKLGNRSHYVKDAVRDNNSNYLLNKWELMQGDLSRDVKNAVLTDKNGIIKIIELLDFPDAEAIKFVQENILQSNNTPQYVETKTAKYMQLPINILNFDKVYQRNISQSKVREIVRKFDLGVVGALIVSEREDGYYLVDGQHRVRAMELVNIKNVMCLVHKGLTLKQEAELYIKCNNSRKNPTAMDNFRAMYISGDQMAADIVKMCNEVGYKLYLEKNADTSNSGKYMLFTVSGLSSSYKTYGADIVREALEMLKALDVHKPTSTEIQALSLFIKRYANEFSRQDFVKKVSKMTQSELLSKSRSMTEIMGGHVSTNLARLYLNIYNEKKQTRLEDKFINLR